MVSRYAQCPSISATAALEPAAVLIHRTKGCRKPETD